MRPFLFSPTAVLLLAGLVVCLPGLADVVEAGFPDGDCSEPCPGDSPDGQCPSSCDECTCCPRAMSATLMPLVGPDAPRRVDLGAAVVPARHPLVLDRGVYHPPRS